MRMTPVYNNVMRVLGHIQEGSYIDGIPTVRVMEDTPLVFHSPSDPMEVVANRTVNYTEISKQEIMFRDSRGGEVTHYYLVTTHKLPDWFWKNRGCVELKLEDLRRIRL